MTVWQYDNQTVRLKRGTTDKDMLDTLDWTVIHAEMSASEMDICFWKKIPRFLVALDRQSAEWDRNRASLADESLRNKRAPSALRKVLLNDRFFVEKNCGSPKAFFEPYLR